MTITPDKEQITICQGRNWSKWKYSNNWMMCSCCRKLWLQYENLCETENSNSGSEMSRLTVKRHVEATRDQLCRQPLIPGEVTGNSYKCKKTTGDVVAHLKLQKFTVLSDL